MNRQIEELKSLEVGYSPSPESIQSIENKKLFAFIGAFAVGKTTLINRIAETDERFSEVISFTTRPSRGEGDAYRFIDNSPENIKNITAQVRTGSLINFAVHPTTNYVYGTEAEDYQTEHCMLATTANSFETSTGELPFASVDPVAVVVEPDLWVNRISSRLSAASEVTARAIEAKQSLEWCLDSSEILYIDNSSVDVSSTARAFIRHTESPEHRQPASARKVAEKMLARINTLL